MKPILFLGILAIAGGWGCKKSNSSRPAPLTWTPGSTVYIVGQDSGFVTYWTNGVKTRMTASGYGNGITVAGSDVYIGGTVFSAGTVEKAAIWKNGVETDLTDTGIAWAFQPGVRGGDVYVPGYVFGPSPDVYPVVWKNGQRIYLDATRRGIATGLAVADTDIYVIGQVYDGFDTTLVWKNGERWGEPFVIEGDAFGQIVSFGSDVYMTLGNGYYMDRTAYSFTNPAAVYGIFVSGSAVLLAGTVDSVPKPAWWEGGRATVLPTYTKSTNTSATGIAMAGSDIYVIGTTYLNGRYKGVIWKNGVEDTLTGNGELKGILVR